MFQHSKKTSAKGEIQVAAVRSQVARRGTCICQTLTNELLYMQLVSGFWIRREKADKWGGEKPRVEAGARSSERKDGNH